MSKLIVLLVVSAFVFANARHTHPHESSHARHREMEEMRLDRYENEGSAPEYVNVEVEEVPRNIKPNRFVPLNNAIFFMGHMPCAEEGFKRDYLGICREVWD